jgi:predicted N-acetyltransferase YhbS
LHSDAEGLGQLTVRNMKAHEYPAVKEIVARSFEDHVRDNPDALDQYAEEPWYDPDHLLVAESAGKIVSQMGVREGSLWISGCAFPAGLVGTVCTLPEWRGKAIGARMLAAAHTWMGQRGIALSYLHTSEARYGFYGRAGYRLSVIEQPKVTVQGAAGLGPAGVKRRDARETGIRVRPAGPEDAAVCNRIYEAHYGRMAGAWSRSGTFWRRRLAGKPKLWLSGIPSYRLAEADGIPAAYLAAGRGPGLRVIELAALPGQALAAEVLLAEAIGEAEGDVEISMGAWDPLWETLASYDPGDFCSRGHVFVRMEDLAAFEGAAVSHLADRADSLGLTCAIELRSSRRAICVGSGKRRISVELEDSDLCALVYNGRRLPELLELGVVGMEGVREGDLEALFPDTHPARCPVDGY